MRTGPRFDVITIFPEQFSPLVELGVVGRALKKDIFTLRCWTPRDFTLDAHKTIDDRPFGGGPGMVMMVEPLLKTLVAIRAERQDQAPLIYLTPHGPLLKQAALKDFCSSAPAGAIFLCGRYEGVDQRFIDACVDYTFCLGDFVLSGGELAVACMIDAWARLLPNVLNHALSAVQESFETNLLDCPHYTRPDVFENNSVPSVLLSGNHAKIDGWRLEQSRLFTERYRPDLLVEQVSQQTNEQASVQVGCQRNPGSKK